MKFHTWRQACLCSMPLKNASSTTGRFVLKPSRSCYFFLIWMLTFLIRRSRLERMASSSSLRMDPRSTAPLTCPRWLQSKVRFRWMAKTDSMRLRSQADHQIPDQEVWLQENFAHGRVGRSHLCHQIPVCQVPPLLRRLCSHEKICLTLSIQSKLSKEPRRRCSFDFN